MDLNLSPVTNLILFAIFALPFGGFVLLCLYWLHANYSERAGYVRYLEEKTHADSLYRKKAVAEALAVVPQLKKPLSGPLNEKQVTILYALCCAGEGGLLMEDIAKTIWGWEGSRIGFTRFLVDLSDLWHTSAHLIENNKVFHNGSTNMIIGPPASSMRGIVDMFSEQKVMSIRFVLDPTGYAYLLEHKII